MDKQETLIVWSSIRVITTTKAEDRKNIPVPEIVNGLEFERRLKEEDED